MSARPPFTTVAPPRACSSDLLWRRGRDGPRGRTMGTTAPSAYFSLPRRSSISQNVAGVLRPQSARAEIFFLGCATVCREKASTAKTDWGSTESCRTPEPLGAGAGGGVFHVHPVLRTNEASSPHTAMATDRRVFRVRY